MRQEIASTPAPTPELVLGLLRVVVEPSAAALEVETSQSFSVTVYDKSGNQIADPLLSWQVDPDVGMIDQGGLFTAGAKAGFFEGSVVVKYSVRCCEGFN